MNGLGKPEVKRVTTSGRNVPESQAASCGLLPLGSLRFRAYQGFCRFPLQGRDCVFWDPGRCLEEPMNIYRRPTVSQPRSEPS